MSEHEKTLDIIFGRWKSQILHAGVKLGVFDCVNSVPKADAYIMKMILHDWSDDECVKIRANIYQ
jgi:hypothetical protein